MDILIQVSQFILSLSLLIILHELGHFIPAKLFNTKVEKFYLFFDPWFSVAKKKIGDTEYGIGWLPLGGYVKIAGMIDESMDKEQMKQEPQDWEFRSKPAWQRLIIMVGGVTVNVILAIIIYAGMMMHYGEQYLPNENITYGLTADSTAQKLGFRNGDKILAVGDKKIEKFNEISLEILLAESPIVKVEREGKAIEIQVKDEDKKAIIQAQKALFDLRNPYVVADFTDTSAAKTAGFEVGDSLVALNGEELLYFDEYYERIPQLAGQDVNISIYRNNTPMQLGLTVPATGKLGMYSYSAANYYDFETVNYDFFSAFPAGANKAATVLSDYIRQFKLILNPETGAASQVGGFIMIAKQFDTEWNWQKFWSFTAFLSIMLAFLNILPIPALDGGHIVFVLWEMITGRKPNEKFLEYAQMVGFFLLLALIILANGNDILGLF